MRLKFFLKKKLARALKPILNKTIETSKSIIEKNIMYVLNVEKVILSPEDKK